MAAFLLVTELGWTFVARLPGTGLLLALGCGLGAFLSPDYDQEMIVWGKWKIYKALPPITYLLGAIWIAYWMPYALLMKHRGLSHWPILGTLTRLIYLLLIPGCLLLLSGQHLEMTPLMISTMMRTILPLIIGLTLSDIGHLFRDLTGFRL